MKLFRTKALIAAFSLILSAGATCQGTGPLSAHTQPVHRGCRRSVRRVVFVQLPRQSYAARAMPRHGAAGKAGWHQRRRRGEVLS